MRIYQTAHYQVKSAAVDRVRSAVRTFVEYVSANEPGTLFYAAWQSTEDPTKFVHLFTFADEDAQRAHGASEAARQFETVYQPELADGPVRFTNYEMVATHRAE
jgi:quinol monooxygenase YgiN